MYAIQLIFALDRDGPAPSAEVFTDAMSGARIDACRIEHVHVATVGEMLYATAFISAGDHRQAARLARLGSAVAGAEISSITFKACRAWSADLLERWGDA